MPKADLHAGVGQALTAVVTQACEQRNHRGERAQLSDVGEVRKDEYDGYPASNPPMIAPRVSAQACEPSQRRLPSATKKTVTIEVSKPGQSSIVYTLYTINDRDWSFSARNCQFLSLVSGARA